MEAAIKNQFMYMIETQLGSLLSDQVGSQTDYPLCEYVRDELWHRLTTQLGERLWGQLQDELGRTD